MTGLHPVRVSGGAIAALLAAGTLAGCGPKTEPAPANSAAAVKAQAADAALIKRIEALPPGQLDLALFRAIRDAGQECQGIAAHARLPDQAGRPAWSARCEHRDGDFLLVLQDNGMFAVAKGRPR